MSVRFDAATDQLAIASAPSPTSAITGTAWVRNIEGLSFGTFFRLRAAGTIIALTASSGGLNGPQGNTTGGVAGPYVPGVGDALPVNSWRRIGFKISGTTCTVYWGDDAGGATGTASATVATGSPTDTSVGGRGGGDTSDRWGGDIAHLRFWTAVLSQAEIEAEWASATAVRTSNLWASWPLTDASTLTDASGNGRTLTAGSTAVTTQGDPPIASSTTGVAAGLAPSPTGALAASVTVAASVAASAPSPTGALAASVVIAGATAGLAPSPTGALDAGVSTAGVADGLAPSPTGAVTATVSAAGVMGGQAGSPTGALDAEVSAAGVTDGQAPSPTGALDAGVIATGALAGVAPSPTGALAAEVAVPGSMDGSAPGPSGAVAAAVGVFGVADGLAPVPVGTLHDPPLIVIVGPLRAGLVVSIAGGMRAGGTAVVTDEGMRAGGLVEVSTGMRAARDALVTT